MNPESTRNRAVRRGLIALGLFAALTVLGVVIGLCGLTRAIGGPPNNATTSEHLSLADLGTDDGYIADGDSISPHDTEHPALARLDPALLAAVQSAATDAEADGIEMVVSSGWRSARYQQALFDEAVVNYLSETEARKWVKSADTSRHVTGLAVDIGFTDADSWLSQYGADYGLCQTYSNEMWHFELAVGPGETCPAPHGDASSD